MFAADRLDVTEEIVRLRSHVEQFRGRARRGRRRTPAWAGASSSCSRRWSREVNTIGSKGGDAPLAHLVVELKTELERIREQVLNVE